MQKSQSSKFTTWLNSCFLSVCTEKGSSMLCLFSNLGPTPTCSKSVGIFILFNLMEGDSNLKLFGFGKQIKYMVHQRVRHAAALYQIYLKVNFYVSFPEQPDLWSVVLYLPISLLERSTTNSRHSTAPHTFYFLYFKKKTQIIISVTATFFKLPQSQTAMSLYMLPITVA